MKFNIKYLFVLLLSSCIYTTSSGIVRPTPDDPEYQEKMKIYLMELDADYKETSIIDMWLFKECSLHNYKNK
ncbi:MAG: hypothetical protein ACRCV0_01450 [Brevinema sp.]